MKNKIRRGCFQIACEAESVIKKFTNSEIAEKSIGNVADELGISYQHLARAYSQARGYSITQFFNVNKIKRASLLLRRYPRIQVKKVANILGYSSESYFAKTFKKYYHVSPMLSRDYYIIKRRTIKTNNFVMPDIDLAEDFLTPK